MRIANVMLIVSCLLSSASAAAQCTKDTDCKGTRLCEVGRCVSPSSHAPAATPTSAPNLVAAPPPATPAPTVTTSVSPPVARDWFKGYASLAPIILPKGYSTVWGHIGPDSYDGEIEMETANGIQIDGRYAVRRGFHIGGFLTYYTEGDFGSLAVGVSMKLGGPVGNHVFMSLVLDLGYQSRGIDMDDPFQGLLVSPRFQIDFMTVRAGGFKWALFVAQGIDVVPYASTGTIAYADEDMELSYASVRPYLLVGTTFGG